MARTIYCYVIVIIMLQYHGNRDEDYIDIEGDENADVSRTQVNYCFSVCTSLSNYLNHNIIISHYFSLHM